MAPKETPEQRAAREARERSEQIAAAEATAAGANRPLTGAGNPTAEGGFMTGDAQAQLRAEEAGRRDPATRRQQQEDRERIGAAGGEPKPDYIIVTVAGGRPAKRRGGQRFTTAPTVLKTSDLTDEQYQLIQGDPDLKVQPGTEMDVKAVQQMDAEYAQMGTDVNAWRAYADRIRNELDTEKRKTADLERKLGLREASDGNVETSSGSPNFKGFGA
jgi:hypothetical protein